MQPKGNKMETIEAIKLSLQEGEGLYQEFKERISNLDQEIVAFANSDGGVIYLGVNDQGEIVGIDITNKLLSQIKDIAHNCDPSINIKCISHKKLKLIEIQVEKGTDKPYRCKGGFYMRMGPNSQKLKRDEIVNFINNTGKIRFEEQPNTKFDFPADFSEHALKDFLQRCQITSHANAKDILLSLNAAKEIKKNIQMTNAGILFFAKNPQQFFLESMVTFVQYQSNESRSAVIDRKDFKGTLIEQIENVLSYIKSQMKVGVSISPIANGQLGMRQDIYDYPLEALREAIVNAVTHRDYLYDGSHIYVHLYPNRIEIENPGGLYRGLTVNDLGKRSVRRNPLIADLLHRAKYIERVGGGIDRMREALKRNNNPPLKITPTNFFDICFYRRLDLVELESLSERQIELYRLFSEEKMLTKKQAATRLNVSEDTALREIKVLLNKDLIFKQGVGKSTSYHIKRSSIKLT